MSRRIFSLPSLQLCNYEGCTHFGVTPNGRCVQHCSCYGYLSSASARPLPSSDMVNPIGVELEVVHPRGVGFLGLFPFAVMDGSLPHNGAEIKTLDSANKIKETAGSLALKLHHSGATATRKCGFHVHLSLPSGWHVAPYVNRTAPVDVNINAVYSNIFAYAKTIQPYFFSLFEQHRQRNQFCRRIGMYESEMFHHYSWFSWSTKIPTIEIRIHGGTVNPWKVQGWLDVMTRIQKDIHKICKGETVTPPEKFSDAMEGGSIGKRYLLARERNPSLGRFGAAIKRNGGA